MTNFLVQTTGFRVGLNNQHLAQHETRVVMEKMTYSLRNAYDVQVAPDGKKVAIYSHNFDDPSQSIVTVYRAASQQLQYGQAIGSEPPEAALLPVVNDDILVQNINFTKISSSLQVDLTLMKKDKTSNINSTIAFRQK